MQGLLPLNKLQLGSDIMAGITLAALGIPEVMGYTKIIGTPVITGLYTIFLPMVVFAVFGFSISTVNSTAPLPNRLGLWLRSNRFSWSFAGQRPYPTYMDGGDS
jgi:hypothetical protein